MTKIGGEYRDLKRDRTVREARRVFLERLIELAPGCILDLYSEVLRAYRQAVEATSEPPFIAPATSPFGEDVTRWNQPAWLNWRFEWGEWELENGSPPELPVLRAALDAWAREQYMDAPWMKDVALRLLRFRLHWLDALDVSRIIPFLDAVSVEDFVVSGWVPQWEAWDDFEERISDALTSYRQLLVQQAESAGFEQSPLKRGTVADTEANRHFDWLILWNVLGWSKPLIAKEYGIGRRIDERHRQGKFTRRITGESTIRSGIKSAAELIDLPVRVGRQGSKQPD